jgi:hypothetical protein
MNSEKVKNRSFMSFPRRRESSLFERFWTPAFAGVTAWRTFYVAVKEAKTNLDRIHPPPPRELWRGKQD